MILKHVIFNNFEFPRKSAKKSVFPGCFRGCKNPSIIKRSNSQGDFFRNNFVSEGMGEVVTVSQHMAAQCIVDRRCLLRKPDAARPKRPAPHVLVLRCTLVLSAWPPTVNRVNSQCHDCERVCRGTVYASNSCATSWPKLCFYSCLCSNTAVCQDHLRSLAMTDSMLLLIRPSFLKDSRFLPQGWELRHIGHCLFRESDSMRALCHAYWNILWEILSVWVMWNLASWSSWRVCNTWHWYPQSCTSKTSNLWPEQIQPLEQLHHDRGGVVCCVEVDGYCFRGYCF